MSDILSDRETAKDWSDNISFALYFRSVCKILYVHWCTVNGACSDGFIYYHASTLGLLVY